ncbi:MAG: Nramp family divalent metal transporter [Rubrobacter sp.]|nr:Nramp family divalent metal transporter [Rubrobacter sp.]
MTSREAAESGRVTVPSGLWGRLRIVGPGLVLAATTVGIGDFVANAVAGERFGTTFIWAILLAVVLKFFLTEGLGRYHLASGQTIIHGWNSISRWATVFVAVYLMLWAFIFGAAGPSIVGLAANAMFPVLPVPAWAVIHSLLAFLLVLVGRYYLFENIMKVLILARACYGLAPRIPVA